MSKSREYAIFRMILRRCRNPKDKAYENYGGRGIDCTYDSFEQFFADVGQRPAGHWIERLDNEKGYGPGNCKWVSPRVNQINKRVSRVWVINGVEYESSRAAADALGVDISSVNRRCNGYTRDGRTYAPWEGWASKLKYG